MTAKEKAEELFQKFFKRSLYYQPSRKQYYIGMVKMDAKKCAIICVDEIIYSGPEDVSLPTADGFGELIGGLTYWQSVRKEIELL